MAREGIVHRVVMHMTSNVGAPPALRRKEHAREKTLLQDPERSRCSLAGLKPAATEAEAKALVVTQVDRRSE